MPVEDSFDQNVPHRLRTLLLLEGCEICVAAEMGWAEVKNGKLLAAAEQSGFDVICPGLSSC